MCVAHLLEEQEFGPDVVVAALWSNGGTDPRQKTRLDEHLTVRI